MLTKGLMNAFLESRKIGNYYDWLIKYTLYDEEDTDKYRECIRNIQISKVKEKQLYNKLTLEEIVDYVRSDDFLKNMIVDRTIAGVRIRGKLLNLEINRLLRNDNNSSQGIGEMIDNSIGLEAMKKTYRFFEDLDISVIEDEEALNKLKSHNKICKYEQLTAADNIEDLALNHNFNLEEIPLTKLSKIKAEFEKKNIPIAQYLYIKFFKIIEDLKSINNDEMPLLNTYYAYEKLTELDIIMNNVSKEVLKKIISKFERDNQNNHSEIIKHVKILLKKRKEN